MCGLVGYHLNSPGHSDTRHLWRSLELIRHRGPDSNGLATIDPEGRVEISRTPNDKGQTGLHRIAIGHVRFSVVDLSDAGRQPFLTSDGKVCVSMHGEIYNYVELRQDLVRRGYKFMSESDTEVLARAYQCWGVDCFERFDGFWGLALYDVERKKLLLARDHIGKAPLYFSWTPMGLFWSSEIKGLLELVPEERDRIRTTSVAYFANWLKKDFGDSTFYENIRTFPSASFAWIDAQGNFEPTKFWNLKSSRKTEAAMPVVDAVDGFHRTVSEAVRIRMRADAPVAVQLSGGMDSSTLVAKAAETSEQVVAYTISNGYGGENEEPYARAVAQTFGDRVSYNVIHLDEDDFVGSLGQFSHMMDEPYHSPNQISNQIVWRHMAERGARVVLYGAGGDEVFAGYMSEYYAPYLNMLLRSGRITSFVREFLSCSEYEGGVALTDRVRMLARMIPAMPRRTMVGKVPFIPREINPLHPDLVNDLGASPPTDFDTRMTGNMADWRMNYWLRNDNQNSMTVPIELRMPFLDRRVVEYAFSLPRGYLIRDGWLKWIMRKAMENRLPESVIWRRRKMGFPFPLRDWLLKNETRLLEVCSCDCPFVSAATLQANYKALCKIDAEYVWGIISILLWWRNCVVQNNIHAG